MELQKLARNTPLDFSACKAKREGQVVYSRHGKSVEINIVIV